MLLTSLYLKFNHLFEKLEKVIAVTLISFIVIIVFAGTVMRYVFNNPLEGVDRSATYAMIWLGFIGFQIATSKLRHIEVEFVKARVSETVKNWMSVLSNILAALFFLVLTNISWEYIVLSQELGDVDLVLKIPMWNIILILPISFGISAIRFLFNALLWVDVINGKRKEEEFYEKKLL